MGDSGLHAVGPIYGGGKGVRDLRGFRMKGGDVPACQIMRVGTGGG